MLDLADGAPAYLVAAKVCKDARATTTSLLQGLKRQVTKKSTRRSNAPGREKSNRANETADDLERKASGELMCEATIMAHVGKHPNLVCLIGVVSYWPVEER